MNWDKDILHKTATTNTLTLYHGTRKDNIDSIKSSGINSDDLIKAIFNK